MVCGVVTGLWVITGLGSTVFMSNTVRGTLTIFVVVSKTYEIYEMSRLSYICDNFTSIKIMSDIYQSKSVDNE